MDEQNIFTQQDSSQRRIVMRGSHVWRPPTDVFATEDSIEILVEVAGMRDGEFSISLHEDRLTVTGERSHDHQSPVIHYQMEVRYGEFRTDVQLPWPVDQDNIHAAYSDGFLRIELPRAQSQKTTVIPVKSEEDT